MKKETLFYQILSAVAFIMLLVTGQYLTKEQEQNRYLRKQIELRDSVNEINKAVIKRQNEIIDSSTYCPTRQAMIEWIEKYH